MKLYLLLTLCVVFCYVNAVEVAEDMEEKEHTSDDFEVDDDDELNEVENEFEVPETKRRRRWRLN